MPRRPRSPRRRPKGASRRRWARRSGPCCSGGAGGQAITGNALPVGIALTLLGVLVMATQKTALTQMVGLFASENGIFFTAMAVTQGMPLIIEIGVILDVILAALVMAIMVLRVRSTVDADIADLDELRG